MIDATDLTKIFNIYACPTDRIREALSFGRKCLHTRFAAVDGLTFHVGKGETLALIGQNGSGKSTVLKIVAGLMHPTSGNYQVQGRIASLIELGTGFHPEFSGRANVQLLASLMGFNREEIRDLIPAVIDFSGLGEFVDRPLKTYSSGMWVRLAFSIAVSVNPDVLLIDEALSVGDLLFQQKCINRLHEFQRQGTTIVFVSHDLNSVKNLCDRAILLDHGKKLHEGAPETVCSQYVSLLAERANSEKVETKLGKHHRYGSYRAEIDRVELMDSKQRPAELLHTGERGTIRVGVRLHSPVQEPSVGILIRDRFGNDIFGTNTFISGIPLEQHGDRFTVCFEMDFELGPGAYYLTAAIHSNRDHLSHCYDWIENVVAFEMVQDEADFTGCARLKPRIRVLSGDSTEVSN